MRPSDIRRPRLYSFTSSQDSEEDHSEYLFNGFEWKNEQEIWELLNKKYDPNKHSVDLINHCYRSHKVKFIGLYNKFRQAKYPQLSQPSISRFYSNQEFPNLQLVGEWLNNQELSFSHQFIPPMPKQLKTILDQIHNNFDYIPNLERALLFYPNYLVKHHKLSKELFRDDLIPITTIYWIGFCASAELGSDYLMNRMLKKYISEGGDIQWIREAKFPARLKIIQLLIRKVGRCPWEITLEVIEGIIESNCWSIKQLSLVYEIIIFSQQMATISLALGLRSEQPMDLLGIKEITAYKEQYDNKYYETTHHEKLGQIADVLFEKNDKTEEPISSDSFRRGNKRFEKRQSKRLQNEQNIEGYMKEIGSELTQQNWYKFITKALHPFLPDFQLIQKRRQNKYPILDYSDFNFNMQGYPILTKFTDTADCIMQLIKCSEEMTMNNFGTQKVDTKRFRKAMQHYSFNLCGYTHIGYPSSENIKQLLTLPLKYYIRLLTLSPVHISKQVISQIQHAEGMINCLDLGHIAVIIANTKVQFSLVMFLKCIENIHN